MGIVKKTKEERKANVAKDSQKSKSRPDTPLADSPDPTQPITDLKSALANIKERSAARQLSINATHKKLDDARKARIDAKRSIAGDGGKLYGLATFAGTTGKQTKE